MKKREYKYEGDKLLLKCSRCGKRGTIDCYSKDSDKMFGVRAVCKDCSNRSYQKYYWKNKNSINERARKRDREHRAEETIRHRKYCSNNRERVNGIALRYREKNRERLRGYQAEYRKLQTERLGFDRGIFHHRAESYARLHGLKPDTCPICGANSYIVLHHPSYESFDSWSVVVPCCKSCHKQIHCGTIDCPEPINLLNLPLSS